MKHIKRSLLAIFVVTAVVSCKKDEPKPMPAPVQTGSVKLEFQHNYQDAPLDLDGEYTMPPPHAQKLQFKRFSYIISDITLIKANGEEVSYHHTNPDKGAFLVIQQGKQAPPSVTLERIPFGEYTKIKFRLGISNEAWKLGQGKQSAFWSAAQKAGMAWAWERGYKHTNFEGTWAENGTPADTHPFGFHLTSKLSGMVDDSMIFTRDFATDLQDYSSQTLIIADEKVKNIRFDVNASSIFGGKNKIQLTEQNAQQSDTNTSLYPKIKENMAMGLFKVASIY
ncbi:MbnP family protein [Capnocytophaga sp.]|uniref:MbnP family protein n=1 Tax=Capnocytophaga sp. TaxID=44737 RepID=UPI0026DB0E67|nr:MbnP family protein [Capnocytophaga sp.]MDO5104389.1 hypothetical protein [Capnocytophaga sp.]